jgi:hypothetical protein
MKRQRIWAAISLCCFMLFVAGCASMASSADTIISVIELALGTLGGVLSVIPGTATLSGFVTEASAVLGQIKTAFDAYKANPDDNAFQNLMGLIAALNASLQKILAPTGAPATLVTKVSAIVSAILTQITNLVNFITQLKSPTTAAVNHAAVAELEIPGTSMHQQAKDLETSAKAFRGELKTIVLTPTGDAEIDAAFEKANLL